MPFPEPAAVNRLREKWTDQLVRVKAEPRPDLTRFAGRVGRIVTVNFGGEAIVDFADGAWYNVADFEAVLETVTDETERKKYDASVNSAQKLPTRQS